MSDADSTLENELLSDSGTGIKRPSDLTLNEPEPKKSNVSSADRELNDDEVRESFPIPDQLVGLVIGRGGENISRIQKATNCEIQVQPNSNGTDNRPCTLTGKIDMVTEAKKMLQDVIVNGQLKDEENRKSSKGGKTSSKSKSRKNRKPGGGSNSSSTSSSVVNQWGTVTEEFLVPPDKIGVAIGKGGQNLKNMRTKFNVNLELIQNESEPPGVAKPLRITGSLQQINACRMECFQNMLAKEEKTPAKLSPGSQIRSDFPVPQDAVGVIIGKKGETITNLQGETVTRIQFQAEDKSSNVRGCYVTGTMDGVMRAQQIVLGICRKKMTGQESKQTFGPPVNHSPPVAGSIIQPPMGAPMGAPNIGMSQPGMNWGTPRPPMTNQAFPMNQPHQMNYSQPPMQPPIQEQKVDYPVPSNKTGAVIGKGGEHIIGIKNQTGCQITQNKTNPPSSDPQWKYFTIQGPPDKVALAQKLIQERVGGPPPPGASFNNLPPSNPGMISHVPPRPISQPGFNAPPPVNAFNNVPPHIAPPIMPSPTVQSNTAGPPGYPPSNAPPVVPHSQSAYNYQHPPQQPPQQHPIQQAPPPQVQTPSAPAPANNPDHSAAWAAYYQQMYQQQQARLSTPTTTGSQPDYTKAWEEYFKQQQASGSNSSSNSTPAASTNTQTATGANSGQPDYSAAWAEYYKTMGQYQQYYQQQRT